MRAMGGVVKLTRPSNTLRRICHMRPITKLSASATKISKTNSERVYRSVKQPMSRGCAQRSKRCRMSIPGSARRHSKHECQ
jgi:hypothetical protein